MDSFNIFDSDRRELSGPINAVRLEGIVNGIPKIVYLFIDISKNINLQTECTNMYSQDFIKYLIETFHNLNSSTRMFDFFYEAPAVAFKVDKRTRVKASLTQAKNRIHGSTRRAYLDRVLPLIQSVVEYDKDRDRFGVSEIFKNVRLHYFEIREVFDSSVIIPFLTLPISSCFRDFDITQRLLDDLGRLRRLINQYLRIYEILVTDQTSNQLPANNIIVSQLSKLMYSFRNPNVQEMINTKLAYYMQQFRLLSDNIATNLDIFTEYRNTLHQGGVVYIRDNQVGPIPSTRTRLDIFSDVHNRIHDMTELAIYIETGITDCYLLRRLLDKSYVQNAIVYARGTHIINYMNMLIGAADFKITHVSKSKIKSVSELNQIIKERLENGSSITDLLFQPEYHQCIDITDFPKDFQ